MTRFLAALLASAWVLTACSGFAADGIACVDDQACGNSAVCAFGQCVDPNLGALGALSLEIEPGPSTSAPKQSILDVDLGSDPRLGVELARGVVMSGDVLLDTNGVVAQVIAQPDRSILGRTIATLGNSDEGGAFSLTGVEDLRYRFAVLPADLTLPPAYDDTGAIARGDGTSGLQTLPALNVASSTFAVTGRTIAGDGASAQGVPGLDVRLSRADGRRLSSTGHTAVDGAFSLVIPAPGADDPPLTGLRLEVRATADNALYPDVDLDDVDVLADLDLDDVSLGIVLSPVRLNALVLNEDGAPAGGANLALTGSVGAGTYRARATANADGAVEVDVPPGEYTIVATGALGDSTAGLAILDGAARRTVPLEEALTIQIPPRVRYHGTVTDPVLGGGVEAATLAIVRIGGTDGAPEAALQGSFVGFAAITDADGDFSVDVPPGTYRVTVRPALSSPTPSLSVPVSVPEEGLNADIDLPAHAVIAGSVSFQGADAAGAYVRVFGEAVDESGAAIQLGEGQCGPDGKFEVVVGAGE